MTEALIQKTKPKLWAPYMAAALTVLIWGAMPAATQIAVLEMDPLAAAILRTLLASLVVLPFLARPNFPRPQGRKQWQSLFVVAVCGFVGFTVLFSLGTHLTSVSHSALINSSIPIFTGLFGVLISRNLPGFKWLLGMFLSFLGVVYIIVSKDEGYGNASLLGDVLCLMSSVCVGLGYVFGSRLSDHIGTLAVTFWAVSIAAVLQVPVLIYLWDLNDVMAVSLKGWAALAYLSLGASLVAYVAWYWALAKGGVTKIAPMQFMMPLVGIPLAVFVFDETVTLPLIIAAILIVVGVYLSRKG